MYSVDEYIGMMESADRAPNTLKLYRAIFRSYGKFLGVPVDEIHNHLEPANLKNYAAWLKGHSGKSIKMRLSVLRAYFEENGVTFRPMELKVLNAKRIEDHDDKPLELATIQKMVDLANPHMKAIITFLVSTGCRPGEAMKITLGDVKGDTVTIRNDIAKGRRGGTSYLHAEAREYLDLFLRERDAYISLADERAGTFNRPRPDHDDRLFGLAYSTFQQKFTRLYQAVDGEQGKYRARITPHSLRRYFRTNAVKTMGLDIVEKIMRHEGYLTGSYVRLTDEEIRAGFHAGEDVLYITRRDRRHSENALALLKAETDRREAEHAGFVILMEKRMKELEDKIKSD